MRLAVITEMEAGVSISGVSVLVPVALRVATMPSTGPVARSTLGGSGACGAGAGRSRLGWLLGWFLVCRPFLVSTSTGGSWTDPGEFVFGAGGDCGLAWPAHRPAQTDTLNATTTVPVRLRFDTCRSAPGPHAMPQPPATDFDHWVAGYEGLAT